MTITTTTSRKEYTGNGSTTVFAYDFKILAASDLKVHIVTIATGVTALKTITTHYSVSGVGSASGGNVTMGTPPTDAEELVITREVPFTQTVDYIENDAFPADTHESALDKLTMQNQQLNRDLTRSLTMPVGASDSVSVEIPNPEVNQSKLLAFASDGQSIEATTGRVSSISATTSTVAVSSGASQSATGSATFTTSTGALALALGLPVGNTGMLGGISMQYSTTTTDADPGAGFIRFNNTGLNSATIAYIDDSDGTTDISAWIATWDDSDSTVTGFLTIAGNPNPASPLVIYKVTGLTDASGYTKVNVTYVAGSTSISNNTEVSMSFSPSGNVAQAGLHFKWDDGTSDADPGAGEIAFNHGTVGSVSILYIDDADQKSVTVSSFIQSWDDSTDSTNKGFVKITKRGTPSTYAIFRVSGSVTDASGYTKVPVTHIVSNGTYTAGDNLDIHFTKTGDKGSDASDVFKTISVSGQDDVVADSVTDSLTFAAGEGMTITTTAGSDTVTFAGEDSAASNKGVVIVAGTSPVSVGYSSGTATVAVSDASTSAKGIASFSSDNFAASSGAITIKSGGVDLAAEVTGTLPVANGGTGVTDTFPTDRFTSTGKALVFGF